MMSLKYIKQPLVCPCLKVAFFYKSSCKFSGKYLKPGICPKNIVMLNLVQQPLKVRSFTNHSVVTAYSGSRLFVRAGAELFF